VKRERRLASEVRLISDLALSMTNAPRALVAQETHLLVDRLLRSCNAPDLETLRVRTRHELEADGLVVEVRVDDWVDAPDYFEQVEIAVGRVLQDGLRKFDTLQRQLDRSLIVHRGVTHTIDSPSWPFQLAV